MLHMATGRAMSTALLVCLSAACAQSQNAWQSASTANTVPLIVPQGMPIQVTLDKEVRVQRVGQAVHGRVIQPVYAFDRLVIAVGTEVTGQISKIEGISGGKRTLAALDADFTPAHKVHVEFNELILADGRHIPLHADVTPGSGQVIQLISAGEGEKKKTANDAASEKLSEAKQEARREWENARKQIEEPGKMHRLERYAVAQLPAHPQYIDAGTFYFVELREPLDFGSEPLTPQMASAIGTPPPGSLVHAILVTPLDSGTTQKGAKVEAVLSQPLFDGDRLILPQGSRLKGTVLQVQPARHLSRNGQLRIVFHELVPPDGIEEKVVASLEGVQADKAGHVKLDSEGGAQATSPKTRYLSAGISIGLAALSSAGDGDADVGNRAAGGAGGFKLIGLAVGMTVRSQPLGMGMGAFGASVSVYNHFLARGRDVVFPKDTAMQIGFGARRAPAPASVPAPAEPRENEIIHQ
jgi:type IV secretory pathway VirB10-like protein